MPNYYELKDAFIRACDHHREANANEGAIYLCHGCRYGCDQSTNQCMAHWMFDVLAGRFSTEDRLSVLQSLTERKSGNETGENAKNDADLLIACKKTAHDAKLPAWCKVGAWVLMNNDLCKIVDVNGDTYYPLTIKDIHGAYGFAHPRVTCPVRFRPYSFEEAKGLLGKQMEYFSWNGKYKQNMTITHVGESEDGCHVNWHSHTYWSNHHAAIDGVPIGVPEVDEEAMKNGAE